MHEAGERDLAQGLLQVGQDGAVALGHDGKGEGAVVVLHHADVIVALRQRGLGLDVEAVGVPCSHGMQLASGHPPTAFQ